MSTAIKDGITSLQAGLTPARDKAQTTSYVRQQMSRYELLAAYENSPMAKRVVNQRAEDSFRKWREWQGSADVITHIERTERQFGLKSKLEHAYKQARALGEGYLLINLDDNQPNQPINLKRINRIKSLTVLEYGDLSAGEEDLDIFSEYYGKPKWYDILTVSGNLARIHPSRVVVLHGASKLDRYSGQSIINVGMRDLKNYDATLANVASLVFEAKVDVMMIKGLADASLDPIEEAALMARLQSAMFGKGNNGALMLDSETESYSQKQMSFATLPELIETFQTAFCAAFGYPRSLFFESTNGGLGNNGVSSLEKYYNSVNSDQENVLQPAMYYLDECLIHTALGSRPDDLWYSWKPLWNLSSVEIAKIGLDITKTFKDAVDGQLLPIEVASVAYVNAMTESGAAAGLEDAYNEWVVGNGDIPTDDLHV